MPLTAQAATFLRPGLAVAGATQAPALQTPPNFIDPTKTAVVVTDPTTGQQVAVPQGPSRLPLYLLLAGGGLLVWWLWKRHKAKQEQV